MFLTGGVDQWIGWYLGRMSIDILIVTLVEGWSADMLVTVGRYGTVVAVKYRPTVGWESVMSQQISGRYSTATV